MLYLAQLQVFALKTLLFRCCRPWVILSSLDLLKFPPPPIVFSPSLRPGIIWQVLSVSPRNFQSALLDPPPPPPPPPLLPSMPPVSPSPPPERVDNLTLVNLSVSPVGSNAQAHNVAFPPLGPDRPPPPPLRSIYEGAGVKRPRPSLKIKGGPNSRCFLNFRTVRPKAG